MKTVTKDYDIQDSDERVKYILDSKDTDYEEVDYIPSEDRLTYSNGFHVNKCTALFIDIRGSSELTKAHSSPVLGKMYRAYLSECVAILNQDPNCKQIYINGDCVSGIFQTLYKGDINSVFFRAGQLSSFINLMNWRFSQKGYVALKCGIGMDFGSALMLQGGFYGSGINEIIWMGDVVNNASNLCHVANKDGLHPIQMSKAFYDNIDNADYLKLIDVVPTLANLLAPKQYQANIVSVDMEEKLTKLKQGLTTKGFNSALAMGAQTILGAYSQNALGKPTKQWWL